jgi:CBS domain-containing protein
MKNKESKLMAEFYELKVQQLMDKKIWDLPLITKNESILHVLSILDGKSHVWVVNDLEKKELVGVITHHDVLSVLAPPRTCYNMFSVSKTCYHGTTGVAEDIMRKDPITCRPDERIVDALLKMTRHRIRRLAVVTDGVIVGEITLAHLIHKYYLASQYHPID